MEAALMNNAICTSPRSGDERKRSQRDARWSGESLPLQGKSVVIVEDEGLTQLQLRRLLAAEGMIVAGVAASGPAGVDMVLRERPDFVLMDIKMPGGFDGLEAARRILAAQSTCLIVLTAYTDYQEEALALGACGYLVKPIDGRSLIPSLVEAFRRHRPQ